MADSNREIKNLEKLQAEEKRLLDLQKQRTAENKKLHHMQEKQLKRLQDEIALKKKDLEQTKKANKENENFLKSYNKLSSSLKDTISGGNKESATYLSIGKEIAKQKALEARYLEDTTEKGEEQRKQAQSRLSIFEEINSDLLAQAKATQQAEDKLKGISSLEQQIRDFKAEAAGTLSPEQIELGEDALRQTEALRQKQERLNYLKEQESELTGMLPDGIQKAVGFAKSLGNAIKGGLGPLFLVGALAAAALKSFIGLEESAKKFREETGLTNSQMKGIRSQANQITQEFAETGLAAEDVFNTMSALTKEFSDVARFSNEVLAGLTLLNKNFGVSAESAGKVQGIFEQIGGLSSETATSVQLQVANMAKLAGVAPAKIFEDIAENAEIASTLFQGDVESLTKAAIEARRLGTNLKSVASTTEHLLDFQGNIGDELTAATFVGGQFNLTQARSLAAAGKTVEAQKEVLKQLQRGGDFRKKDYFTQQQLAKAAGMSVEEINKQLNAQEKLNSLSSEQRALADKAIEQGLDISNINKEDLANQVESFSKQQEQQAVLEKISNQFMGIASTVGSVLVPVLDAVALLMNVILYPIQLISDLFGSIGSKISSMIGPLGTVGKILKGLAGLAIVYAAYAAFTAITASTVGFGLPLAIAAAAAITTAGFGLLSKVGDLAIDPNGGPIVASPREGGIFQGTKNDGVSMGPGFGTSGGNGRGPDRTDELIAAIKETKDVYMDGRRVTSNVGRAVEKSTYNNFAI
jgi:hypothetical protein